MSPRAPAASPVAAGVGLASPRRDPATCRARAGPKRPSAAALVLAVPLIPVLLRRVALRPSVAAPGTVVPAGWGPRRRPRFELRAAP